MKQLGSKILLMFFLLIFLYPATGCQLFKLKSNFSSPPKLEPETASLLQPELRPIPEKIPIPNEAPRCLTPEECFAQGIEAEKKGARGEAKTDLQFILDQNMGAPWSRRAEYLLAKWMTEEKSVSSGDFLLKVQADYPEMGDYTAKLLADDAFNQQDFLKADQAYSHILVIYPDTVLRSRILIQKGEALYQLKDYDLALEMFALFLKENPKDEKVPEILLKMFDLYSVKQDWEKAGRVFRDIQVKYPDTHWSQESEKKLSLLVISGPEREKFKLTPQEFYSQGKTLYEIGRFEKALEIWKKLSQRTGPQETFVPEMELKMGLALLPLKKYSEAADRFERFLKSYPHSDLAQEALLGLARIAIREENESELKKIQKKGEQLFPRQEAYYKLLFLIGSYFEEHRQIPKAHTYFQMIIRDLPQNSVTPDALWKEGWISYKEGDYVTSGKNFSRLLERYPSSPLHAQGLYWGGRVKEKMENPEGAQADFKKLCQDFSHSYYCHLARRRILPEVEEAPFAVQETPVLSPDASGAPVFAYQRDDHYLKAKELMAMNLNPEASREFNFLADRYRDKPSLLQIDRELIQARDFYHALKNLRAQFPEILDRGKSYDDPLLWELAYPKEAVEEIQRIAKEIKIEPEFVAGIMREESVFDVRATSKSGAMGLMQLMPFTGEWVAQQLGVPSFVREKLYDQEMNIRFGAFYLDHLNQKFQGNLFYTAASYNAGPEAVSKWIINGNSSDLEEFVENIPYQETRYYVKRVIKSYEEFKEIRSRSN